MRLRRLSSAPTFERTRKQTYSLLVPHTESTNFSRAILPRCENGRAGWHQPCPRSETAHPTESSRKSSFMSLLCYKCRSSEPAVQIGESFWNNKNVGFWWHRNYLIWP